MIPTAIINLIWIAYSLLEGFREGFYFYFKTNSSIENNYVIHPAFTIQRGLTLLIIGGFLFFIINWWSILIVTTLAMTFTYFHDGAYYLTRHKLNNNDYPKGWKDESTTSTAKINMNYKVRTILMVVGLLTEVGFFLLKK